MRVRTKDRIRGRLKKTEHSHFNARLFLYSFFVSMALYTLMLFVERVMVTDKEYDYVYVTASTLNKKTAITEDNVERYFVRQRREAESLPQECITDIDVLIGMISARDYAENEIITMKGFETIDEHIAGIDNPVEVSFSAGNLSQVAGGVLRAGDYINIWSVSEGMGYDRSSIMAELICSYAYVNRVFSTSGEEIRRDDNEGYAASIVNIIIPSEMEEKFNVALSKGTLRVGRCMYEREDGIPSAGID